MGSSIELTEISTLYRFTINSQGRADALRIIMEMIPGVLKSRMESIGNSDFRVEVTIKENMKEKAVKSIQAILNELKK